MIRICLFKDSRVPFEGIGIVNLPEYLLIQVQSPEFALHVGWRGYAIDVREGVPSRSLSGEEREAFEYALRSLNA